MFNSFVSCTSSCISCFVFCTIVLLFPLHFVKVEKFSVLIKQKLQQCKCFLRDFRVFSFNV